MNLLWLKMQSVRYGLTPLELQQRTHIRFGGGAFFWFFFKFPSPSSPAVLQHFPRDGAGMTAGTWALNVSSNSFLIQKHFLWEREMGPQNAFLHPPCWYYCTLNRKPTLAPPLVGHLCPKDRHLHATCKRRLHGNISDWSCKCQSGWDRICCNSSGNTVKQAAR